jgi:hypothetical protein
LLLTVCSERPGASKTYQLEGIRRCLSALYHVLLHDKKKQPPFNLNDPASPSSLFSSSLPFSSAGGGESENVEAPSSSQYQVIISRVLHNFVKIINILSLNRKSHKRLIQCNGLVFIQGVFGVVLERLAVLSAFRETVIAISNAKKQGRVFSVVSEGNALVKDDELVLTITSTKTTSTAGSDSKSKASKGGWGGGGGFVTPTKLSARGQDHFSLNSSVGLGQTAVVAAFSPSSEEQIALVNNLNFYYVSALLYIVSSLWNFAGYENNVDNFDYAPGIVPLCLDALVNPLAFHERKVVSALVGLLSCLTYKGLSCFGIILFCFFFFFCYQRNWRVRCSVVVRRPSSELSLYIRMLWL